MQRIPFVPFPLHVARKIVRPFYGLGERIAKFFPSLGAKLIQAEINLHPREYVAIAVFTAWFWLLFIFGFFFFIFYSLGLTKNLVYALIFSSIAIGIMSFFYVLIYPNFLVMRKVRDLDRNLLFALRHLLIQVRSGVPLFEGLASISKGNYGRVSKEFGEAVEKISTGESEADALEELVFKNPSLYFRRAIWQITNAMRMGADLGDTLEAIVNNLANEQRVAIRKYGSNLSPLAMFYMMTAVIMPSLGITFLILLSAFSAVPINETTFLTILFFLAIFQFMFMGLVKTNRPAIEL